MCHDAIELYACGDIYHYVPDPCRHIVFSNFCEGVVRDIKVRGETCALCIGNIRKLRELTGRSSPEHDSEDGQEETAKEGAEKRAKSEAEGTAMDGAEETAKEEYRPFEKKYYTDEAYEELRKECRRRVWGRFYDD